MYSSSRGISEGERDRSGTRFLICYVLIAQKAKPKNIGFKLDGAEMGKVVTRFPPEVRFQILPLCSLYLFRNLTGSRAGTSTLAMQKLPSSMPVQQETMKANSLSASTIQTPPRNVQSSKTPNSRTSRLSAFTLMKSLSPQTILIKSNNGAGNSFSLARLTATIRPLKRFPAVFRSYLMFRCENSGWMESQVNVANDFLKTVSASLTK